MTQLLLIKLLAAATAIMLGCALVAFLDIYRLFLFYKRQYEKQPRIHPRPGPSRFSRLLRLLLWLPIS